VLVCILPEKAIPEMTYTVSSGMLNPIHSLTHLELGILIVCCRTSVLMCVFEYMLCYDALHGANGACFLGPVILRCIVYVNRTDNSAGHICKCERGRDRCTFSKVFLWRYAPRPKHTPGSNIICTYGSVVAKLQFFLHILDEIS